MTASAPPTADPIRAVVVDDSQFMRALIRDMLETNGIEVVAEGADGAEGYDAVCEHAPDVVTMDIEMPQVSGIEGVERIMRDHPTPILILSSHAGENAEITFEALEKGAVDFFAKPGGEVSVDLRRLESELVETVRSVASYDVSDPITYAKPTTVPESPPTFVESPILAIAASTGGPRTVEQLIGSLPIQAQFRVVIVQHMPEAFTGRFARRLDDASAYDIIEARDDLTIGPGEGVVAQGGSHLLCIEEHHSNLRFRLGEHPPVNNVRPAADVTFQSLAQTTTGFVIAVVVTGMGRDGAAGVNQLASNDSVVIAQDKASSAVFGMPKAAIETGAVDYVVPETHLGAAVTQAAARDGTVADLSEAHDLSDQIAVPPTPMNQRRDSINE